MGCECCGEDLDYMDGLSDGTHDFDKSLTNMVEYFHRVNKEAGWWTDPHTGEDLSKNPYVITTKMALIHSEISEAVEAFRKNKMDDHLPQRKGVEVELADLAIRLFDLCGVLGLDLGGAVMEKDAYNQRRLDHKMENRAKQGGKLF